MRGGRIKGNSFMTVSVTGVDPLHRALAKWLDPELTNRIDVANKKGAQSMAKELRTAMRPVSKHMARAVRVKRARTGKPGWVVGSKRKIAFFWHMVIGGTKAHGPRRANALVFVPGWNPYLGVSSHGAGNGWVRASRVRGVPARPIVAETAKRYEDKIMRQVDTDVAR